MNEPLVSVGIPTYNRAEGLRRSLESLLAQTYRNIQIIVSDNYSPDNAVSAVIQEFAERDSRIIYHRHRENIGAAANFKFLLSQASGEYFMWLADDDVLATDCIEFYVQNIGNSGGIFSTFIVRDYGNGKDERIEVPELEGIAGSRKDISLYFKTLTPSFIYGLFKINAIRDSLPSEAFDWSDCFTVLKVIKKYGYKSINSRPKYIAGVLNGYQPKPFNSRCLNPYWYLIKVFPMAFFSGIDGIRGMISVYKTSVLLNKKLFK